MRAALIAIACASCGTAPRAPVEEQAAPPLAAVVQPQVAADLQDRRAAGDRSILIVCDPQPLALYVTGRDGTTRSGAIAARDCRALWTAALVMADSGGCTRDVDLAPMCIRAIDHGRVATACCRHGENPRFDAAIRQFVIAAARTPTRASDDDLSGRDR